MRLLGVTEPCLPVLFPASRRRDVGPFPYVHDWRISRIATAEEAFLHHRDRYRAPGRGRGRR